MSMRSTTTLLLSTLLLVGCTKKEAPVVKKAPALAPEVTAKLAKADAQDGTVDKVVSNCAGCQLSMAGEARFSAKIGGYTLHLCDSCEDKVDNPAPIIEELKVRD